LIPEASKQSTTFRRRTAELVIAALIFALGAIVMYDCWRLGARWAEDGPETGYFPFYVGLIICISSAVNFGRALLSSNEKAGVFVEVEQLKLVLSVLIPTAVFVTLVGWLGIYVSSILFISFFMRWLGKYPWWKVVLVSFGNSAFFFSVFEIWFLVPLPKGPIESLLGLG